MVKIGEGIHLHILPTKKFKTISIQFRFKTRLQEKKVTKRALLANLMDINSKLYPTQIDFRRRLSELYGANFFTDVARYGNYHVLSLNIECVDEKVINETGIVDEVMKFLYQVIFFPNVIDGHFQEATFNREVDKLRDEFASRYDDKAVYAEDKLNNLYFHTREQQMTSYGQESDLNDITPTNLFDTYLEMLNEDQLDIYVVGNITESTILRTLHPFDFKPRELINENPFYEDDKNKPFVKKIETQEINQTLLTMGLKTPIYYHNQYYYAGLIFNGLLGAMPHSKLFQIVREKENLAYSISSEVDVYRGLLFIYAGIESEEVDNVQSIILDQLEEIKNGLFSENEIEQTKEVIKNELFQIDDTPYSMVERAFSLELIGREHLSLNEWIEKLDSVSREEIIDLAGLIDLKATYILIGENN
ncbi:EF-P 5-aminopentanol modification-associated protein YfmF [Alkalibacterium sp. f15]|uniref:EF-P 5-aminopentanol modification-associated protein YfmF n=1 Tax=Alkalibacterium sp. f15 TaxID=3414029 RepID=UPI003BF87CEA